MKGDLFKNYMQIPVHHTNHNCNECVPYGCPTFIRLSNWTTGCTTGRTVAQRIS